MLILILCFIYAVQVTSLSPSAREWIEVGNAMEPAVPIPPQCETPPDDSQFACVKKTRETPRFVFMSIMLGFETDTLEIALRESQGLVDAMLISEATRQQNNMKEKPLTWSRLLRQTRFQFLQDTKIFYGVVDDILLGEQLHTPHNDIWKTEVRQMEVLSLQSQKLINLLNETIGQRDFVHITSNADEVLSRRNVWRLRWCDDFEHDVMLGAIWTPMGDLQHAFRVDHPALSQVPYGDGRVFVGFNRVVHVRQLFSQGNKNDPSRVIFGGIHMTDIRFWPFAVLKDLTNTEYPGAYQLPSIPRARRSFEQWYKKELEKERWPGRRVKKDQLTGHNKDVLHVPWFLSCAIQRYPYWEGKVDRRSARIFQKLRHA